MPLTHLLVLVSGAALRLPEGLTFWESSSLSSLRVVGVQGAMFMSLLCGEFDVSNTPLSTANTQQDWNEVCVRGWGGRLPGLE
jgi:hypothetical protein